MPSNTGEHSNIDLAVAFAKHDPVELVRHKQYRKLPQVGDIYALEVREYGWILLRVIHKDPSQRRESPVRTRAPI